MERHPHPEELFEFPCEFMFKAFGPNDEHFPQAVHAAVDSVVATALDAVRTRASGHGSYVCVSVLVHLQNFTQVQDIYTALRQVKDLIYLL